MARYTLKQAAEVTGRGKTSIHRDIRSGRLSASKDEQGRLWVDAAELHRVYPSAVPPERSGTVPSVPDGTAMALLEQQVEHLRALLDRERQVSADLSRRLDEEAQERRKLTALLTHQDSASSRGVGDPGTPEGNQGQGTGLPWARWWPWR
jgi:hypothetical protein